MTRACNTYVDAELKDLTTWKIGGKTQVFLPKDLQQLSEFIQIYKGKIAVIGYGSNLLAPSQGFPGVCIVLKKNFSAYSLDDHILYAQSGLSCPKIAKLASGHGYSVLNYLIGIPGSLGGALIMNAGAHGRSLLSSVISIEVLDLKGKIHTLPRELLKWGYRYTILPFPGIVVAVTLDLRGTFDRSIKEIMHYRATTQPLAKPSCGSFFRNPRPDIAAGWLIEQLGFKGATFKGLQVSTKHANFIINTNNACSDDILKLTQIMQQKAFLTTGLILKPEYKILRSLDEVFTKTFCPS